MSEKYDIKIFMDDLAKNFKDLQNFDVKYVFFDRKYSEDNLDLSNLRLDYTINSYDKIIEKVINPYLKEKQQKLKNKKKMTIQPIRLETNPNNKKKAVFIAITLETDILKNYTETTYEGRKTIVPLMLMIDRWDGVKGFIGGNVEEGESLIEAALREFIEESVYNLKLKDINNYSIVSSHETSKNVTHLINVYVNEKTFIDIISNVNKAQHYLTEVAGMSAIHCINYPHKQAFNNFIKGSFAPTVKEEIADLIISNVSLNSLLIRLEKWRE